MSLRSLRVPGSAAIHSSEQQQSQMTIQPRQLPPASGAASAADRQPKNPVMAPRDHAIMSHAERRRAKQPHQPATREERETAREKLQELRRNMRRMKKLGWRGKARELGKRQRQEEDASRRPGEDAAAPAEFSDDEEARTVAQRMGVPTKRKAGASAGSGAKTAAASGVATASGVAEQATSMKRRRVDDDRW